MSYSHKERHSITVSGTVSGSFSYPASESGGSKSVSMNYSQNVPIDVNVHVDTNKFDNSVDKCTSNVGFLTAAVTAAEAANIASKINNSNKLSKAITAGFFNLIGTDINLQITELQKKIDATMIELRSLAEACVKKQRQMEGDYARISSRYAKVFDELDREQENRIYDMDKPVFTFRRTANKQNSRFVDTPMVNMVAVVGEEGSKILSRILVSNTKREALVNIDKFKAMLIHEHNLDRSIKERLLSQDSAGRIYVPVLFLSTLDEWERRLVETPEWIPTLNDEQTKNMLAEQLEGQPFDPKRVGKKRADEIKSYVQARSFEKYGDNSEMNKRIRAKVEEFMNSQLA